MATLNDKVKSFIVRGLACFDTPTEVAEAVKEKFNVVVSRQQIATYDPDNVVAKDLSKKWRDLFAETRERFKKDASDIAIANQTFRLRTLDRLLRKAVERGNMAMAAQLMEQASKEVGGSYTNRREVTGKDGKDLGPATGVLVVPAAVSEGEWEAQASKGNGSAG